MRCTWSGLSGCLFGGLPTLWCGFYVDWGSGLGDPRVSCVWFSACLSTAYSPPLFVLVLWAFTGVSECGVELFLGWACLHGVALSAVVCCSVVFVVVSCRCSWCRRRWLFGLNVVMCAYVVLSGSGCVVYHECVGETCVDYCFYDVHDSGTSAGFGHVCSVVVGCACSECGVCRSGRLFVHLMCVM